MSMLISALFTYKAVTSGIPSKKKKKSLYVIPGQDYGITMFELVKFTYYFQSAQPSL